MRDLSPRRVSVALLAVGLLTGCAQIPSSGSPSSSGSAREVDQAAARDPVVRVFAEGPHDGDSVYSIVSGFLEASSTVEDDVSTARKFLTDSASARWRPDVGVTVYDHTAARIAAKSTDRLEFTAPAEGTVDDQGVYLAASPGKQALADFDLVKVDGNWRIDDVPAGLFISKQDFDREYAGLDMYFLAGGGHSPVLVPDPIYLRRDAGLPTALMNALLAGPSRWLKPAVSSAVPAHAVLAEPVDVVSGVATVRLMPDSVPANSVARDTLLGQIVLTLTEDPDITAVEVSAGDRPVTLGGRGSPRLARSDVAIFQPADLRPPGPSAYYLRDGVSYMVGPPGAQGPFAPSTKLAEIAVAPGGNVLAGISKDRTTLWTAPGDQPSHLSVRLKGDDLRSASFDQDGNLWVLDGASPDSVLRRIPAEGDPVAVSLGGFVARQIMRLRVSSDGTRVAMVLDTVEGSQVYLGLATGTGADLAVGSLRRLGFPLLDPMDIGWADPDRLVVLAAERNAAPQPFALSMGGVVADVAPSLADISGLAVAPNQAIIATTSKKVVYRLRPGGGWFRVGTGIAATYPG
jgi:Lipoprotein LpqB beta-propeller domain/Sporulation and spore germination